MENSLDVAIKLTAIMFFGFCAEMVYVSTKKLNAKLEADVVSSEALTRIADDMDAKMPKQNYSNHPLHQFTIGSDGRLESVFNVTAGQH